MRRTRGRHDISRQRGATLFVGLVVLVLATILVLASFQLGKTNLDIVGNMQHENEAAAAAQQAIETAIDINSALTTSPGSVFPAPCDGDNTQCYDVNGDGKNDVLVTLRPTPTCVRAQKIKNTSLDLVNSEEDRRCTIQVQQNFGQLAAQGDSLCSNTVWDVRAVAQDLTTHATAIVDQGVGVRVRTSDVETSCPLPP